MWKWLILAVAAYVLYRLFMNDKAKKSDNKKEEQENLVATGELVKDPNCGAFIDADSTISVRDGEQIHRFCSYDCRDAFLQKIGKLEEKTTKTED